MVVHSGRCLDGEVIEGGARWNKLIVRIEVELAKQLTASIE